MAARVTNSCSWPCHCSAQSCANSEWAMRGRLFQRYSAHDVGLFFFSSRRRHTRLQGDWSSDVCSSDLKAPGHPEYHWVSGVETTTGPLGQGVATSVGMSIAEKWLANRYNRPGFEIDRKSVV